MISKGEVIGFLNLNSIEPGSFTQEHARALQAFANQAAIAIENARLYASLQEANARLSRALLAREEAIQNVSHELRTPLALMMGYVEFIESGETGPVTGEQLDALRIVAQQGRRLQFIFNSLLALRTFRQQEISPERMDIVAWLHETVGAWRRLASDAGIAIQVEMPHHPLPVMGAPSYLELVIGNLLDNAIKFSPRESTITLSAWSDDDNVLIAVADQGIGIPQEQLDRIFTRFYQIDSTPARHAGGMGIGLALGRAIVAAHGGRIWAESAGPDQGSTFFVALRADPPEEHTPGTLAPGGNV
jgi:signal transduction histidine kinase